MMYPGNGNNIKINHNTKWFNVTNLQHISVGTGENGKQINIYEDGIKDYSKLAELFHKIKNKIHYWTFILLYLQLVITHKG